MGEKKAQEKNSIKGQQKKSQFGNKLSYNSCGSIKFNKSDIVWAKITGYPWWPALVTTVPGQKDIERRSDDIRSYYPWSNVHHNVKAEYRVDFIADETHAFLKKNFLLDYNTNRDRLYVEGLQFSTRKRRFFQMAVNEADQLQQVMELSKRQMNQCQGNRLQKEENLIKTGEDGGGEQNVNESQQQQKSDQHQQQQNQEQNQPRHQDKPNRFTKSRNNINKSNRSSLSISHRTKTSIQQYNSSKKNVKSTNHQNDQPQLVVKRGRPCKKSNLLHHTETKIQSLEKDCSNDIERELFVRFEVQEKRVTSVCRKGLLQVVQKQQSQAFQQIIQLQLNNQNTQRSASNEKPHSLSIPSTVNEFLPIKAQNFLFQELLIKYNLHKIDQVQQRYKNQKLAKIKDEAMESIENNSGSISIASTNKMFIKNVFTAGIGRKKHSKKASITAKLHNTEEDIFAQNLSIIGKLKQSDQDKISTQQKQFLIQTSKRRTARKIYSTILHKLHKNHIQQIDQQTQNTIRQRCKRISNIIFDQEYIEKYKGERKSTFNIKSNKGKLNEGDNFVSSFKKKLQENVYFIRFLSMENWDLLARMESLPMELCIEIKSFQQFLENHCHLYMRNQEKFQDIAKQIGIDNQKTAFAYLHPPIEIMDIENDYGHVVSPEKIMSSQEGSEFTNVEKKNQNVFVETK